MDGPIPRRESDGKPRVPRPGTSRRGRYWLYLMAFGLIALTGLAMGYAIGVGRQPGPLDRACVEWVQRHRSAWPAVTAIATVITRLGNPEIAAPTVAAIIAVLTLRHVRGHARLPRHEALVWLIVVGGERVLNLGLKAWFGRERPPVADQLVVETSASFPSGHAMFAGLWLVLALFAIERHLRRRSYWRRSGLIVGASLVALAVAVSRVWLGVHYATDILSGFLLGVFWAILAIAIDQGWIAWPRGVPLVTSPD